jgi:hypothetical protein
LKPEPTTATLFSSGLSDESRQRAFDAIPSEFRKAFDYRKLQWVVLAWVYRLEGHTVCRADVGVSARAPVARHPRNPGFTWSSTWEMTQEESYQRNAEETCKGDVTVNAIKSALEESWDKAGLLDGFDVTKEDGVPAVLAACRLGGQAPQARRTRPSSSASPAGTEARGWEPFRKMPATRR